MEIGAFLAAIGIGTVSGLLAGMLGIGGGIIVVPAMVLVLGLGQHTAQGVSLAAITLTSGIGTLVHTRGGYVQWKLTAVVGPTAALGAFLGAQIAHLLNAQALQLVFAAALFLVGLRIAFTVKEAANESA